VESWSSSVHGELRRRKVTHVAVVYVIVGIAVIEVANLILEPLQLGWLYPAVVVLTILCFSLAPVLAWAFDVTPSGVVRTHGPSPTLGCCCAAALLVVGTTVRTPGLSP
jgi:hypothetical protein